MGVVTLMFALLNGGTVSVITIAINIMEVLKVVWMIGHRNIMVMRPVESIYIKVITIAQILTIRLRQVM